jgi:Dolichyl-phosphate-mannose-protein mannosyltransferase
MEPAPLVGSISSPREIAARTFSLLAVLIAILHAFMAITATMEKSPTYDEPAHLTAGYSYWLKNDFRLNPENGNLPQRWASLPLLLSRPNFISTENEAWRWASEGLTARQFFYERGNDSDSMLRQGRVMIALISAALCLLIYRCSRELFGPIGGLLSEVLAAFDPTMLAHGALVTSDIAATFFFLASVWSVWRMFDALTVARFALAAASLSGLFLAKFSAPLIIPIVSILGIMKIFSRDPIAIQVGRFQQRIRHKFAKARAIIGSLGLLSIVVLLAIWASFSFRFAAVNDEFTRRIWNERWDLTLAQHDPADNVIAFMREHHLLPEAYLYGLAFVHAHQGDRPAFLDKQWSLVGFRSFFPRAFLYKTPLALLLLLTLASGIALLRWRKVHRASLHSTWEIVWHDCLRLAPFWTLALIYGACALTSNLNLGQRHLLPIYPALFVACGACSYFFRARNRLIGTSMIAVLLLWQTVESIAIRPNYLAYFNQLAGGPSHGSEHLVDSSIDWGQDLPALKNWLDEHGQVTANRRVYLAYFGSADPAWYGIHATPLPRDPSSNKSTGFANGIYCISATTLQQVYSIAIGRWAQPYENAYQKALAEMAQHRRTITESVTRADFSGTESSDDQWREKVKTFEDLRFARLCAALRVREPIAKIGYSIFIYSLSSSEVDLALYGPPAELTPEVSVVAK